MQYGRMLFALSIFGMCFGLILLGGAHAGYANEQAANNKEVQVVLVAAQQAMFSSPFTRRVHELPFKDGDTFKKGDTLIAYDCRIDKAEHKQAKAMLKAAKAKWEAKKKLKNLSSISDLDLVIAEAEYEKAKTEYTVSEVNVDYCVLEAPYDGRITGLNVNLYETVKSGQDIISIASLDQLDARMLVPSKWLSWLKIGTALKVHVFETGQDYTAKVEHIGGAVDEVSQSIMIVATLQNVDDNVLPGMTGKAVFEGGR